MVDIREQDLRGVGERLVIRDEASGDQAFRVNIGTTIHFLDYHLVETREALAQCVYEFYELFDGELRWRSNPKSMKIVKYPGGPDPVDYLADPKCIYGYEQIAYGAESKSSAPTFRIEFAGFYEPLAKGVEHPGSLGFLYISVTINWWLSNKDVFLTWIRKIVRRMPVRYGHCGLSGDVSLLNKYHGYVAFYVAQNYWGVNLRPKSIGGVSFVDGHIGSIDWINILSDKTIDHLGGLERLISDLESCEVHYEILGDRLLVQASEEPQIGFRHVPQRYSKLAEILKAARIEEQHMPFPFDFEKSKSWLARFDENPPVGVSPWPGEILAKTSLRLVQSAGNPWLEVLAS